MKNRAFEFPFERVGELAKKIHGQIGKRRQKSLAPNAPAADIDILQEEACDPYANGRGIEALLPERREQRGVYVFLALDDPLDCCKCRTGHLRGDGQIHGCLDEFLF